MPLDPGSTYAVLSPALELAHAAIAEQGPDAELDLQGYDKPLWGNHSLRRFADTVARQTMALTGTSEQDINLYFGWLERFYQQKMQIHYESRFTRTRRTAVTSMAYRHHRGGTSSLLCRAMAEGERLGAVCSLHLARGSSLAGWCGFGCLSPLDITET